MINKLEILISLFEDQGIEINKLNSEEMQSVEFTLKNWSISE